jgi:hypothetical protein
MRAGVQRVCARLLLVAALGLATTGLPALAADEAAAQIHARCIPWRGVALAVVGGALAGWALMRLGQRPPPAPPPPLQ